MKKKLLAPIKMLSVKITGNYFSKNKIRKQNN